MVLSLTLAASASAEEPRDRLLTDFRAGSTVRWMTVNDGVMGGRSRGDFRVKDGVLRFAGATNTQGGGFSSIRAPRVAYDLTGYDGIRLRVRADGRRYTFRLSTSTTRKGRYQPSYWADFETDKDAGWQIIDVPFERFRPQWRGQRLSGPALDLENIDGLGLMIYDKRDGPFLLEADWIRAYRKPPAGFSMAQYRGAQRPLVVFAPNPTDVRLTTLLSDVAQTRRAFDERDMVLVVVCVEGASKAGETALTGEQAQALRAVYGVQPNTFSLRLVGKDGGVKRSSDTLVSLSEIYELIDSMPMRKREMRRED